MSPSLTGGNDTSITSPISQEIDHTKPMKEKSSSTPSLSSDRSSANSLSSTMNAAATSSKNNLDSNHTPANETSETAATTATSSRAHTPITSGTSLSSVSTSSHRPTDEDSPILSPANDDDDDDDHAANAPRSYYYLTPLAVRNLPSYQYHGADLSLLYQRVLSPLAGCLVDRATPSWLAPNAITLLGLAWMATSYAIVWWHCPGLYEANDRVAGALRGSDDGSDVGDVPRWIFLFNGVAMLAYQTLDNMDGKQARKTRSSSPLGLLFDHGCDAVNSILGSANWMAAMAMVPGSLDRWMGGGGHEFETPPSAVSAAFGGDEVLAALLVLCPMIAFYVSTWEQYYTGKLILPPFNGPSEGLVLGASLSILSFLYGPMIWQSTSLVDTALDACRPVVGSSLQSWKGTVRNMDLIVLSSVLALLQEISLKIRFVLRTHGAHTLRTLLPHALLVGGFLSLLHRDPTLLLRRPRTTMHLISGLFVEQTTQLMLDHMVNEEFLVRRRWSLVPLVVLAGAHMSVEVRDAVLLAYATGLWVYLAFKIRVTVYEICDVLGIWCFDIVTPHPKRRRVEREEERKRIVMEKEEKEKTKEEILGTMVGVDMMKKRN
mmetsp:Transcript_31365/g.66308  ORF Transcript_31365/g.66308 Transcript_31365/m.66308 type:complete len:604 (-) Transcript_31365:220-2031(-)|eukprot:CAMPEP_0171335804 /NCGR_PEP_ID=MMETSP0878-20121228/5574_1 /TAXON_ID=67004 /ORGANISM="Thalassiosira weissflogii, Strain CCMP1336" /LENGTH=603 /DNA_ID=CAMNT_0011837121 /DNA_START=79 /DNA_END=1890 /DNA_ORIENTATION=+